MTCNVSQITRYPASKDPRYTLLPWSRIPFVPVAAPESVPGIIDISMRRMPFYEWMGIREYRAEDEEAPGAMKLALLIAQSGAAGISRDGLRRLVRLSPDTLEDLLAALVAAGQVTELRMNGRRVFRATM